MLNRALWLLEVVYVESRQGQSSHQTRWTRLLNGFKHQRRRQEVAGAFADMLRRGTVLDRNGQRISDEDSIQLEAKKVMDETVPMFLQNCFLMAA